MKQKDKISRNAQECELLRKIIKCQGLKIEKGRTMLNRFVNFTFWSGTILVIITFLSDEILRPLSLHIQFNEGISTAQIIVMVMGAVMASLGAYLKTKGPRPEDTELRGGSFKEMSNENK